MSFRTPKAAGVPGKAGRGFKGIRMVLAWSPLFALALFLLAAVRAGLSATGAVVALLAMVVTQVIPGILVWRAVRPRDGTWFEDLSIGAAVGVGIGILAQTGAVYSQISWLTWVIGPAIGLTLLVAPGVRDRIFRVETSPLPTFWGPAVAAASLLLLRRAQSFYTTQSLSWPEGFRAMHPDMPFHMAISSQVAHRAPVEVPWVLGEPLHYHWFSHAWIAQVSTSSGVPLDAILLRFLPPVVSVLLVCAVAAAAFRIGRSVWAALLAALIAAVAGNPNILGAFHTGHLALHLSPSLGLSIVLMTALLSLLVIRWRSGAGPGSAILVVALAVGAAGTKGSSLPIVVAGVGLALAASLFWRWSARKTIAVDFVLLLLSLGASFAWVFGGRAERGLELDPAAALSRRGVSEVLLGGIDEPTILILILASVLLALSVGARGAGFLAMARDPFRRDPASFLLLGAGMAGVAAVMVLHQAALNQWYFFRNAEPAIAIGSAIGLTTLGKAAMSDLGERPVWIAVVTGLSLILVRATAFRPLEVSEVDIVSTALGRLAALTSLVLIGGAIAAIGSKRAAARRSTALLLVVAVSLVMASVIPRITAQFSGPLPQYSHNVDPGAAYSFSTDQIEAARWLRDHSEVDDIVATNRHCASTQTEACGTRRFFVAAYTERRVLVEGWAYTESWSASLDEGANRYRRAFWDPETLALNDALFNSPSRARATDMSELGVDWLYVDKTAPFSPDLHSIATPRYETAWAWILELNDLES